MCSIETHFLSYKPYLSLRRPLAAHFGFSLRLAYRSTRRLGLGRTALARGLARCPYLTCVF